MIKAGFTFSTGHAEFEFNIQIFVNTHVFVYKMHPVDGILISV